MRARHAILSFFISLTACAQNWALLNPAYKYNYSNDGTDTISNQIKVIQTETLGPDSFRYVLNRTAEVCNACGDTCDLRKNLPQFLQGECNLDSSSWYFTAPGELVIRSRADLNDQWIFDIPNGTAGTLSGITEELIIGSLDSVRTMTTSLNDTVRWSKTFGVVHWHLHNEPAYDLIGIHDVDVGVLIPSLAQFFPFQPGDVVQFVNSSCSNFHSSAVHRMLQIQQRTEQPDQIVFSGTAHSVASHDGGIFSWSSYGPFTWIIDSLYMPIRVLRSAPQELVNLGNYGNPQPVELNVVAKHRYDDDGNYVIEADRMTYVSLFLAVDTLQSDCTPMISPGACETALYFNNQLGLREFHYCLGSGCEGYTFLTIGAVIGGDTMGTWLDDEFFHVGINEAEAVITPLYPDPATEQINVPNAEPGSTYTVIDTQGRMVVVKAFPSSPIIDVRHLHPGTYVLLREDRVPQRFIIAR